MTDVDLAAERHLSRGCIGAFQSAEWALVKWLTGTDEVVDHTNSSDGSLACLTGSDQAAE